MAPLFQTLVLILSVLINVAPSILGTADVANKCRSDLRGKRTRHEILSFGHRQRQSQEISSEKKEINGTCRKKEGKTKEKKERKKERRKAQFYQNVDEETYFGKN